MIICLEGINGCGKSTLAKAVTELWRQRPGSHAKVVEPAQMTAFGRKIHACIMGESDLDFMSETLAFVSARLHACADIRRIERDTPDQLLIIERWAGAVVAYGRAAKADASTLSVLEQALTSAITIKATYLLDVPGTVAAERLRLLSSLNKFETRGAAYLEHVGSEYRIWANDRGTVILSGASGSLHDQAQGIVAALLKLQ